MISNYDIKFTEELNIYNFSDIEELIISVIECLAIICILLILCNNKICHYIPLFLLLCSSNIII